MGKAHDIVWDVRASAARNARRNLPQLMSWYFAGGRALLANDASPSKLHELRLATKRVRYTLELFRECYGTGLGTRLTELRHVQQLLGELNDTVAAGRLLAKPTARPHQGRIEKFLEDRLSAKMQEFRRYWSENFDAPGQEQRWTQYLGLDAGAQQRR